MNEIYSIIALFVFIVYILIHAILSMGFSLFRLSHFSLHISKKYKIDKINDLINYLFANYKIKHIYFNYNHQNLWNLFW